MPLSAAAEPREVAGDARSPVRPGPQLLRGSAESSRVKSQSGMSSASGWSGAAPGLSWSAEGGGAFAARLRVSGLVFRVLRPADVALVGVLVGLLAACPDVPGLVGAPAADGGAMQGAGSSGGAAAGGGARDSPLVIAPRRIDLRVLVLSARDVGTEMMKSGLREAGVPFTEVELEREDRPAITDAFLSERSSFVHRAKFQAIVAPNEAPAQLRPEERAALAHFQQEFGIRRVDGYVYPSPVVQLSTPDQAGYSGVLDGMAARLTPEAVGGSFGYLVGSVSFDDVDPAVPESYGYLAHPIAADAARARSFTPLLEALIPGTGSFGTLIGVLNDAGREEMVIACAMNALQLHQQALFPGILNWLTRGVHLGSERNYLTVHIDDLLLSNARWVPEHRCTRGNDCPVGVSAPDIALTIEDVDFMTAWQAEHGFGLSMVFNGGGYDSMIEDYAAFPVGDRLLAARTARWVNHTYTHEYLGCVRDQTRVGFPCERDEAGMVRWVSLAIATDEIGKNQEFARRHELQFDPSELVTGEHSGLRRAPAEPADNPSLLEALSSRGIAWVASDASRERDQRAVAGARTVPRYPMNLYFNVGRRRELVDEFNWIHSASASGGSGSCSQNAQATCLAPIEVNTGFDDWIVPREARTMALHALSNDPRPHYAHQSNLAEDRLLYPVMERVLSDYRRVFGPEVPLVQLTLAEAGTALRDQAEWQANQAYVQAYVETGTLTVAVSSSGAVRVPLTLPAGSHAGGNTAALPRYAGQQTGWLSVRPKLGQTLSLPAGVTYAR